MKSCGVIVEYNPFHNGHAYHLEQSRETAQADCMVAVMSGNFLQRGEPAIIDKWQRTRAALQSGVDLVLELPYLFAVQHSDYFSQGAVQTLSDAGVDAICFGSENGSITPFIEAHETLEANGAAFNNSLRKHLDEGFSYPEAARFAYKDIGLASIDLGQPNNILGYSYIKQILTHHKHITPLTIERSGSQYHDQHMGGSIASATSIRKELLARNEMTEKARDAIPSATLDGLTEYYQENKIWHHWEHYFSLLQYKILTTPTEQLQLIHGVDEGLEHRFKHAIKKATSFHQLIENVKTKRYTWTRLQRTCVHILTGLTKEGAQHSLHEGTSYVRVLGMNKTGQGYLNEQKKRMNVPLLTQPQQWSHPILNMEERAVAAYYSALPAKQRVECMSAEYGSPVRI
ncbi:nucleotidyltransferase [Halobacillus shinanisalinarum]|uniref:tRNA(Met) cytidine acetate ligase n=1 Tax=Halobacillus shinanisalinarum TaxID=2932258 RepID=A0ABY4GYC8_9BACI|nr:nucleotidyltransferase [Halobacillus shinanisalinarum]UOQ93069.1 nucleotidyltransferase [Halobacillus shinanisalinarum]